MPENQPVNAEKDARGTYLTERADELAKALADCWHDDWANRPNTATLQRLAGALISAGAVVPADTLADERGSEAQGESVTETERDAIRMALLAAMSDWSEEHYCAGWLIGLEHRLHREGGVWETLGRMVGWPIGVDAEGGWETWEEAGARYATPDYQVEQYGRVLYPTRVIPPTERGSL